MIPSPPERRPLIRLAALASLALCTLLGACADRGDLGRARPSVWNNDILPSLGTLSAIARDETVSTFHMTDDEGELRARSWNFIMPAHERSWFDTQVSELARTRIIPVIEQSLDHSEYHRALTSEKFRSGTSRYNKLTDDVLSDRSLIIALANVAKKVVEADRVRMKAAKMSRHVSPDFAEEADARVVENQGLILWVCERVRYRTISFRHTLDNLVVEMPGSGAIRAERAILGMEDQTALLTRVCSSSPFETQPVEKGLKMVVKYRG